METINPTDRADYSLFLTKRDIPFQIIPGYFVVGVLPQVGQTWAIHVSLLAQGLGVLFDHLVEYLQGQELMFHIAQSDTEVGIINSGRYLNSNIGKVLSVFGSDDMVGRLAVDLVAMTGGFPGPRVWGGYHLGGAVYVTIEHPPTERKEKFELPRDITWPFETLKSYQPGSGLPRKYNGKYIPFEILKDDPKGKVIKALRRNHILDFKWVILKGGTRYMCTDATGKDMTDRLKWQVEVLTLLPTGFPTPKIFEYFERNGDGWLAMEYIGGEPLSEVVRTLHHQAIWLDMTKETRLRLLDYYLQILGIVKILHQVGIVHRDLTTMNFMVNKESLVLLDLELSYSLARQYPMPPFGVGSAGYMSEEQVAGNLPTYKEDIFALGAILQKMITGVDPFRIFRAHVEERRDSIEFFCRDVEISELIAYCLDAEARSRPQLDEILEGVRAFRARIAAKDYSCDSAGTDRKIQIRETVQKGINYLAAGLQDAGGNWKTRDRREVGLGANESGNFFIYGGLFYGVSGVIYLLSRASEIGFEIEECLPPINKGWQIVLEYYLKNHTGMHPGLGEGMAGIATAMISASKAELLPQGWNLAELLPYCFGQISSGLDVLDGMAGQGIAALQASLYRPELSEVVEAIVAEVLRRQDVKGHWVHPGQVPGVEDGKWPGLLIGNAGIVYFLLQYWQRKESAPVWSAIKKGLHGILLTRKLHSKDAPINMSFGISGIALCLIEAFRVTRLEEYRDRAKALLLTLPQRQIYNDLSLNVGMTGIGEVYIEAYKVFEEEQWLDRAHFIADALIRMNLDAGSFGVIWMTDSAKGATADLLVGSSGILHFLMRCLYPDRFGFPGLSTS